MKPSMSAGASVLSVPLRRDDRPVIRDRHAGALHPADLRLLIGVQLTSTARGPGRSATTDPAESTRPAERPNPRPEPARAPHRKPSRSTKLVPTRPSTSTPRSDAAVAPRSPNVPRVPISYGPPARPAAEQRGALPRVIGRWRRGVTSVVSRDQHDAAVERGRRVRGGGDRTTRSRRRNRRDRCGGRTSNRSPRGS